MLGPIRGQFFSTPAQFTTSLAPASDVRSLKSASVAADVAVQFFHGKLLVNRGVSVAALLLGLSEVAGRQLRTRRRTRKAAADGVPAGQRHHASDAAGRGRQRGASAAARAAGVVPPGSHAIRRNGDDEYNRPPRNPVWGLMLVFGFGGGGDDLVKVSLSDGSTQTLSAGDGLDASLGLMLTPVWVGDALGIGVSGTLGYKGWSVGGSNGDISIGRFPFTAGVHLLPRVAHNWLLLARGGIDKEADVSVSCSGVISCTNPDATANLGWFGEAGFYYTFDILQAQPGSPHAGATRRVFADVPLYEGDVHRVRSSRRRNSRRLELHDLQHLLLQPVRRPSPPT